MKRKKISNTLRIELKKKDAENWHLMKGLSKTHKMGRSDAVRSFNELIVKDIDFLNLFMDKVRGNGGTQGDGK